MTRIATVRASVLESHGELLDGVLVCADEVAESWTEGETTDRAAVVEPFERLLEATGLKNRLPAVLVESVEAVGEPLSAEPVAAPPYVTVTSRGVVLRATLETGRLVVMIRVFDVERTPTRYVRGATTPSDALDVAFKTRR